MNSLPLPNSLILVAYIPRPRDLEVARILGWYRIPLRTAPKVISVDYLAFYQPASFGDRKWCIETVASVRGHELVTRAELLKDEPNHPNSSEEYFKVQLGPLIPLPAPIFAQKWKRITFFYTTGKYLLEAETIKDLIIHTDERKILWQSLRERANWEHEYDIPEIDVAPEVLTALLGIKDFEKNYKV